MFNPNGNQNQPNYPNMNQNNNQNNFNPNYNSGMNQNQLNPNYPNNQIGYKDSFDQKEKELNQPFINNNQFNPYNQKPVLYPDIHNSNDLINYENVDTYKSFDLSSI